MNLNLKDKVIIVSGGAKGIGRGIVKVLSNEGAIPIIIGRNLQDADALVQEIKASGATAYAVEVELTKPEACKRVIKTIADKFGKIDGLVNNAGVNDGVDLEHGNYELFMQSLHKNLVHYYLLAQECLPYLKLVEGAVVNIGSKTAETDRKSVV